MKNFYFAFVAVFGLALIPSSTAAQMTCAGCKNTPSGQECTRDDPETPIYDSCIVEEEFCQLMGQDLCMTYSYADIASDHSGTAAGTYAPNLNRIIQSGEALLHACTGYVVEAKPSENMSDEAPRIIRLD